MSSLRSARCQPLNDWACSPAAGLRGFAVSQAGVGIREALCRPIRDRPIRDTRVPRPTRCRRSRTRRFPGTAATPRRCRTGLRDIGHRHARSGPRRCRHDHPETTARRSRQRLRLPPGVALRAGRLPLRPRPPHRARLLAPQAVAGRAHQAARVLLRRRGLRLLRHEQPVFAALARFRHSWYSRWHLAMFPHRGSRLVMPRRFWRGSARQC